MKPRPAILIIGNFLSLRKRTRGVCEDLADHLAARGYPILVTSRRENRLARLVDMVFTVWRHRREYEVAQVDVFSGDAFFWAETVCGTLRCLGKPFVITLHGGNLPAYARRHPRRVTDLLHQAAAVTAPSEFMRREMSVYRPDLQLLPNAIDLARYPYRRRRDLRPQLAWLRAFHQIYNPMLAVRVVAALADEFPEIHLTMIGPDQRDGSWERIQRAIAELQMPSHIACPGSVPKLDVPEWLNRGDLFINTTNVDNMPVSVIEAMACGLGVVSTNVGGLPSLLTHEHDGLLVPPDSVPAMAAAVRRLLREPDLAETLSANARRKAETFDWGIVLREWEKLIERIHRRPCGSDRICATTGAGLT